MKRVFNSRGETLVESIISILIFAVLIATVTTILIVSMRATAVTTAASREMQERAGEVWRRGFTPEEGTVRFILRNGDVFEIRVVLHERGGFSMFEFGGRDE